MGWNCRSFRLLIIVVMLKSLKGKKDGKADPKKDTKKEKKKEKEVEKKDANEQEEETNDALVDIEQFEEKAKAVKKTTTKFQANKLEEKDIDTSNIVVEKKKEEKPLKSWVVDADKVDTVFRKDFDMSKVDTEFTSLTDQDLNKELEKKAKIQAEENKNKPVEEIGGIKFAVLEKPPAAKVDVNEPPIHFRKPEAVGIGLPLTGFTPSANPPTFTNSNITAFKPLQKTPQQLREEEIERKMQEAPKVTTKAVGGWLGGKKNEVAPPLELKVSPWAQLASQSNNVAPVRFAELKNTDVRQGRDEQEFVYTNKKDQEERRRKREQAEKEKAEKAAKI